MSGAKKIPKPFFVIVLKNLRQNFAKSQHCTVWQFLHD
jgi:hypothetical protein